MKRILILLYFCFLSLSGSGQSPENRFDLDNDLLLLYYDCKTDVDDLHSVAAFITLSSQIEFASLSYHAVAGTYGTQEGLYVPPNPLFELAFADHWTDADANFALASDEVCLIAKRTLDLGGNIWIAEAGQSDFSAEVVKKIQVLLPEVNTRERIHIVQHSDWNEEVTSPESLDFVKNNTIYHKIPDGNVVGNGTPGFRSPTYKKWHKKIKDPQVKQVWQLAYDLGNQYNAKEGRYNNEAIAAGGLDFSDTSEVCWILGLEQIKDTKQFFKRFGK
ncbi:MAG: hypothetical protein WBV45_11890 [Lutimonas sp.]